MVQKCNHEHAHYSLKSDRQAKIFYGSIPYYIPIDSSNKIDRSKILMFRHPYRFYKIWLLSFEKTFFRTPLTPSKGYQTLPPGCRFFLLNFVALRISYIILQKNLPPWGVFNTLFGGQRCSKIIFFRTLTFGATFIKVFISAPKRQNLSFQLLLLSEKIAPQL